MAPNEFTMYGHPISPEEATGKLQETYAELEAMLGSILPHVQLHATHALEDMKCFTDPMKLSRSHPEIPLVWFALMRLHVAVRDDFPYCKALNTNMLRGLCDRLFDGILRDRPTAQYVSGEGGDGVTMPNSLPPTPQPSQTP